MYSSTEIDEMHISVRHGCVSRKKLKSDRSDLVQIAYGAVRYCADAAEPEMNVRVNFTPKRAASGMRIDILQDYNPRSGYRQNVVPPVRAVQKFR